MKRLAFEQRFTFDKDHGTDMWIIGAPLPAFKILMHIEFDDRITEPFQFKPVFTYPMQPQGRFQTLYNVPAKSKSCNLLVGIPERTHTEEVNVIQVQSTSAVKISGKITVYEIDKENRFEYTNPYSN